MKILHISASYKPAYIYGGPIMSVAKLCEQMVKAGCTIEVFTTTANGTAELPVTPNKKVTVDEVEVTYFKRLTKDHSHFSPALMQKLWRDVKNFDLVHVHAWWNMVSVLSCWIAILRNVPVLVSPRGTLSAYSFINRNNLSKRMIHGLLGKVLLKKSNLHVTSKHEKVNIEAIIKSRSIFNIPNFIALPDKISIFDPKNTEQLKLIFFSRIEEKKGLDVLLNALQTVRISYHLTIAGDGEPEYLEKLKLQAEANGIANNISWIGFQGDNKFDLLQQHDLMILPSHDENFGNVVIESLSVGTAVLISKNVGLMDYVSENNLGWVCELEAGDISRYISLINTEKAQLAKIRQQAPAQIRNDFNEENLTKNYMNMYSKIIHNG